MSIQMAPNSIDYGEDDLGIDEQLRMIDAPSKTDQQSLEFFNRLLVDIQVDSLLSDFEVRPKDITRKGISREKPIEEILEQLASEVPDEEWDKLPIDLSENLDYYLYS